MINHLLTLIVSYVFLTLVFSNCSDGPDIVDGTLPNIEIIGTELSRAIEPTMSKIFHSLDYIPLETNGSSLISGIARIYINDDRIYVFEDDTEKVLNVFNKNGFFLFKIDGTNRIGPEHYVRVHDFNVDEINKIIEMPDFMTKKMFRYNMEEGKFIKSVELDRHYSSIRKFENGKYFLRSLAGVSTGTASLPKTAHIMEKDLNLSQSYLEEPLGLYEFLGNASFTISESYKDNFLSCNTYYNTIYRVTNESIVGAYQFIPKNSWVPNEMIERLSKMRDPNEGLEFLNFLRSQYVTEIDFIQEFENTIFIYHFSGVGAYWNFYNKSKKTVNTFKLTPKLKKQPNDIDFGMVMGVPRSTYKDQIVFLLQPNNILNFYQGLPTEIRSKMRTQENNKFYELVQKIDYYDNPIVVFAKLKEEFR